MKFEASSRHSDGYFLEVNSVKMHIEKPVIQRDHRHRPIITGMPLQFKDIKKTDTCWGGYNTPYQAKTLKET